MDNTQYFQSGHGRTGSNYPVSGNPPAGKWNAGTGGGCYTSDPEAGCHASTAAHVPASASDPYRLGATYADNTTALCLTCHGAAGPAATRNMQEHSKAVTGSSKTWPGSDYPWKCVDCHDPHGDGTDASLRINMVRSAINNPTGTDNANVGSNGKGSPMRPPGWTAISFTDNTGFAAGSYAQPGTGTWGICEGCHRNTSAYSQTLDNVSTHGTRTGRCTTCHSHSGGFRASCNTCHGDGASAAWPDDPAGRIRIEAARTSSTSTRSTTRTRAVDGIYADARKNGHLQLVPSDPGRDAGRDNAGEIGPHEQRRAGQHGRRPPGGRSERRRRGSERCRAPPIPRGRSTPRAHACLNVDCQAGPGSTPAGTATVHAAVQPSRTLAAAPGDGVGFDPAEVDRFGRGRLRTGTAYRYEVRYRTGGPVTAGTWATDNVRATPPAPRPAGDNQVMTGTVSPDNTTVYYFGIKAFDAAGNASGVSNSPDSKAAYDNVRRCSTGSFRRRRRTAAGRSSSAGTRPRTIPCRSATGSGGAPQRNHNLRTAAPNATTNGPGLPRHRARQRDDVHVRRPRSGHRGDSQRGERQPRRRCTPPRRHPGASRWSRQQGLLSLAQATP